LFLRNPGAAEGRWVQVTARPLVNEQGLSAGGVAALVDVTERRLQRRRLEEHPAELSRFGQLALTAEIAASATHQLSQPIAAISAFAGAAIRLRTAGRMDDAELNSILERIERLSRQSGDVLDGLRGLIRRRSPAPSPIDLNAVAETCLDLLRERTEQYGVRVDRHYAPDLPMPVGDTAELEQVLLQIMNNALEAMDESPSGTRRLSIRTRCDHPADRVVIELTDTGRGVRRDIADSVFDPWVTDKADALGIGLSIAQTIIERLGGRIAMRSTARGARLTVELPASPGSGT
jgi:two-component system sensor histidine kinase DctS